MHLPRLFTAFTLVLVFCMLALSTTALHAAPYGNAPRQASDVTQSIDVVVLLDDSGSMAMCWPWPRDGLPFFPPCGSPSENPPSDPDELRYSAARLLVQLADDNDRVAVVRFDAQAEGVGALSTLQPVGPAANRSGLTASLQAPTDYLRRGYTRLDLGLEQVINLLQSSRTEGRNQYILLLTDGEPTEPGGTGAQEDRIRAQIDTLRQDGVFVFPVVLCNPSTGCSGEFLHEAFAEYGVREAATAPDLLRVFSQVFAEMKPDRSVITGNGTVSLNTRESQGVGRLSFVSPRGELLSVQRNGEPFLTQPGLDDPNVDVSVIDAASVASGMLPDGRWSAEMNGTSGFAVVQADSYPQLINPPPSVAESPASTRYYPAGKPPLLLARGVGPGADELLLYNGDTPMTPFDGMRALFLDEEPNGEITLQLGEDETPLRLERTFRVEPRRGLPQAEVFAPTASGPSLTDDGRARLQVGFSAGADVDDLRATVYVNDISSDVEKDANGNGPLVYQAQMSCADRLCTDTNFTPQDGRSYDVLYIIDGRVDALRFSDWAQATFSLEPAVYLRGLPATLDLAQMPPDGWPVELSSGTTEEIGMLQASLELRRVTPDPSAADSEENAEAANADTDAESAASEAVSGVALNFAADVPEEGSSASLLKIEGLETLRPGEYEGEITLAATTPAGRALDVQIRPSPVLPVQLNVPRPLARIDNTVADFGAVLFDTSPNFRLEQEVLLPVAFEGNPFKLTASLQDSSCAELGIVAGDLQQQESGWFLPLRLRSQDVVMPNTCSGAIAFAGPNADYDVTPAQIDWQVRVDAIEWSLVNGELSLGDLRKAGERVETTLLVRFNGQTPFVIQAEALEASGDVGDGVQQALTPNELEFPPVEISGPTDESGLYEVPVALVVRQDIPNDPLRGTFYSGEIALSIVGLPDQTHTLGFNLRSPTLYQRYMAPIVVPIYGMPMALLSWPLTLFALLIVVARVRGRNFEEDEWEEAAVASLSQAQMASASESTPFGEWSAPGGDAAAAQPLSAANADAIWNSSTWGNNDWNAGAAEGDSAWDENRTVGAGSDYATNGHGAGDDPWRAGW